MKKLLFLLGFAAVYYTDVYADVTPIIGNKIGNAQETATVNDNFNSIYRGKLDIRPKDVIPREDDTYDLGSSTYSWDKLYINDVIAKGIPYADIRAFGALCDGATDDLTAYHTTRDYLITNYGGGTILSPTGTCVVSGPILLKSSVSIAGLGQGVSIIKLKDGVMPGAGADGGRVVSNFNWTVTTSIDKNIGVYDLTIDGNKANNPDIALGSAGGVSFGYATNVRIERNHITNVDGYGAIYFGNTISGAETGELALVVNQNKITNSTSSTAGGSYGTMMFITAHQTQKVFVTNNYGYENRHGIFLEDGPSYAVVSGNIVEKSTYSNSGTGVFVNAGASPGDTRSRFNIVSNNVVRFYGSGYLVSGSSNTAHIVSQNVAEGCDSAGFKFATGGSATDIIQQIIAAENHAWNTRNGPGFTAGSAAKNITFIGNHAHDNQTTKTQTYGLVLDATTSSMTVVGNDFTNNLTGSISVAGNNQSIVFNQGYTTDQFLSHDFYVGTVHQQGLKLRDDGTNSMITSGAGRGTGNLAIQASGGSTAVTIGQTGGIQVGAPTGGDLGNFNVNVASDIYQNNSKYNNPDYAFEMYFTGKIERFKNNPGAYGYKGIMPLPQLRQHVQATYQLPRVGETRGIFERADIALEKLEEAYIYIFQLEDRIKKLEACFSREKLEGEFYGKN